MRKRLLVFSMMLVMLGGRTTLFADEVDNAIAMLNASVSTQKDREALCLIIGQLGGTKAQKALFEFLQTHGSNHTSMPYDTALSTALAQIGGPQVENNLIAMLSNINKNHIQNDYDSRALVAAKVLGGMKSAKAVNTLVAALKIRWRDDSFYEGFAQALELIGDRSAGNGLAEALQQLMLNDPNPKQTKSIRWRVAIIHALGKLGNASMVKFLVPIMRNPDSTVRGAAVKALRELCWSATTDDEKIWIALADKDWDALAAMHLRAIPALIAALAEERSVGTARKMLLSLGVSAIAPLIDVIPGHSQGKELAVTLAAFGAPAYEPLIAALKGPDSYTRIIAIDSLGLLKDSRAAPFIAGILAKEGNESFANSASAALAKMGSAGAEPLYTLLSEKDEWARFWAAATLILGNFASEQRLTSLGQSSDNPDIRGACAWVLVRIGNSSSKTIAAELLGVDPAQEVKKPVDTKKNVWLLITMLETTSDSKIADVYLNSKNKMLNQAAWLWAKKHGYRIQRY